MNSHRCHRLRQRGDDHRIRRRVLRLKGGCRGVWQAHPPVYGPVGSLEMSPPPGRSEREGSSAGAWIRKREDARAAGVRASCVSVSVEHRCDTRPVAEAAMGLAPCLLSRLSSAGSLARAVSPNSCTHSESMAGRSQLSTFECGPQCRMNRESLAAIQPLPSPMPTFRVGLAEGCRIHQRTLRSAPSASDGIIRLDGPNFRRIIPAPQAKRMASQMG